MIWININMMLLTLSLYYRPGYTCLRMASLAVHGRCAGTWCWNPLRTQEGVELSFCLCSLPSFLFFFFSTSLLPSIAQVPGYLLQ